MTPEDLAALEKFMKEISALDGDALIDRWIAQEDQPKLAEFQVQKELSLEVALAAKFGITKWRSVVQARKKAIRNADQHT
jgi:hypothetical protein